MSLDQQSGAKPFRRPEDVYLTEDRYEEPKETFKFLASIITSLDLPPDTEVLDVGCATGEFLYYLKKLHPGFRCTGFEPSEEMLAQARDRVPGVEFFRGSLADPEFFTERRFDLVICCAVIPYFRDLRTPLTNLLSVVRQGGVMVTFNSVNEDPIDTHVLYRSADAQDGPWLPDCTYSKASYERIIASLGYGLRHEWRPFRMPFALPKQPDLIRAWTIETADNPYQLTCGTQQLFDLQGLVVKVEALP